MKNNILHHNRQSSFNSMQWVSSSTHTCPDHFCELQAAFCPRTICEYAHDEWECKVNSARQNRHGPFQNIKPFNNKLYSSCWISVRQKKTKRRKFICFFYSRNDGAKNSMESWKSRSMCGVRSFVYVFPLLHPSRTTLTKTHWIPKPIRLSTWILCVCVCVHRSAVFFSFVEWIFHRHFRHYSFHFIEMEFRMRSINKRIEYRDVRWKFIQVMVRRSFLFKHVRSWSLQKLNLMVTSTSVHHAKVWCVRIAFAEMVSAKEPCRWNSHLK